jgi:hypothetical protein
MAISIYSSVRPSKSLNLRTRADLFLHSSGKTAGTLPALVTPKSSNDTLGLHRNSKHRAASQLPRSSSQSPQPSTSTAGSPISSKTVVLGHLLSDVDGGNERYQCPFPTCTEVTFGRPAELKRHHASCHKGFGTKKPQYWCPVSGCRRSRAGNGNSFPRKDKMMDHLERMHKEEMGGG